MGLKTLETILGTTGGALGVSLVISDDHDGAVDTRTLRCTDGCVDPLLERLKQVHGERK